MESGDGKVPLRFFGQSGREVAVRVFVLLGVVLAYVDPVILTAICRGGV